MTNDNMTQTIPKRVVVLGGGGFVGSSIVKKCKKERIVKTYVEKTEYHKTKSQKRKEKKDRAIRRARKELSRNRK